MSRELADAIEKDLSADEEVKRRYGSLMAVVVDDVDHPPDDDSSSILPPIAFTESEKPDVSDTAELRPLLRTRLSQFVPEETNRP